MQTIYGLISLYTLCILYFQSLSRSRCFTFFSRISPCFVDDEIEVQKDISLYEDRQLVKGQALRQLGAEPYAVCQSLPRSQTVQTAKRWFPVSLGSPSPQRQTSVNISTWHSSWNTLFPKKNRCPLKKQKKSIKIALEFVTYLYFIVFIMVDLTVCVWCTSGHQRATLWSWCLPPTFT